MYTTDQQAPALIRVPLIFWPWVRVPIFFTYVGIADKVHYYIALKGVYGP
jgi:hypothetical protein